MTNNLRDSAKESNDGYDVAFSLTVFLPTSFRFTFFTKKVDDPQTMTVFFAAYFCAFTNLFFFHPCSSKNGLVGGLQHPKRSPRLYVFVEGLR